MKLIFSHSPFNFPGKVLRLIVRNNVRFLPTNLLIIIQLPFFNNERRRHIIIISCLFPTLAV